MLTSEKKLKLRRGFTIVEAIVAAALLTMIASTSLLFLGFGTSRIGAMRDVTENNFVLVHDIELQMRAIRMVLDDATFVGATNPLEFYVGDETIARQAALLGALSLPVTDGISLFEVAPNDLFNRVNSMLPLYYPYSPYLYQGRLPDSADRKIQVYLVSSALLPVTPVDRMYSFIGQRGLRYPAPRMQDITIEFVNNDKAPGVPFETILAYGSEIGSLFARAVSYTPNTPEYLHNGSNIWGGVNWQWWVSGHRYSTVLDSCSYVFSDEGDFANRLRPEFPRDFEPILGAANSGFPPSILDSGRIVDNFRGRHIALSATPFSNLGRMGNVAASNIFLFIIGLPDVDGLPFLHLSAGIIGREVDSVTGEGVHINANGTVRRWNDIRNPAPALSAFQGNPLNMPILTFTSNGVGTDFSEFNIIDFRSDLSPLNPTPSSPYLTMDRSSGAPGNGVTIFVVARRHSAPLNSNTIIRGAHGNTVWELGFDDFAFTQGSDEARATQFTTHSPDTFYVISGRARRTMTPPPASADVALVKHGLNGNEVYVTVPHNQVNLQTIQLGAITIGNESASSGDFNAAIAEIIIFDWKLDDNYFDDIVEYLMEKYSIS